MRAKTLITILLALFVVVALGAIVMKSPAPEGPAAPPSATEAAPVAAEVPASVGGAESQTAVPVAAPVTPPQSSPSVSTGEPSRPVSPAVAKPVTSAARASSAPEPAKQVRRVVATYFHGNVRCATCRKVESYAREAVEGGFKAEVASGAVEFRAVNLDEAANAHFIQDYQLVNKSVVVTEELDGKVARWAKLDEVWSLVGNRDAYHHYVQDAVRGYLETE